MSFLQRHVGERMTSKTYSRKTRRVVEQRSEPSSKRRRIAHGAESDDQISKHAWPELFPSSSPPPESLDTRAAGICAEASNPLLSSSPPRSPSTALRSQQLGQSRLRHRWASASAKRRTRRPLQDISNSRLSTPSTDKQSRLTQLQIDLGGEVRRTCASCGMNYIPSNIEDVTMHKTFHSKSAGGLDIGRSFTKNIKSKNIWIREKHERLEGDGHEGVVVVVDRKSSSLEKVKAKMVLDAANIELSAVHIEDANLWSEIPVKNASKVDKMSSNDQTAKPSKEVRSIQKADRFKVYLYIKRGRCLGVCLAERISEAFKVLEQPASRKSSTKSPTRSSSISVSDAKQPAVLGISRIWTSPSQRRQGVASRILECARSTFIYGMQVPKDALAFSQPTESGKYLAESWFGQRHGWLVYDES